MNNIHHRGGGFGPAPPESGPPSHPPNPSADGFNPSTEGFDPVRAGDHRNVHLPSVGFTHGYSNCSPSGTVGSSDSQKPAVTDRRYSKKYQWAIRESPLRRASPIQDPRAATLVGSNLVSSPGVVHTGFAKFGISVLTVVLQAAQCESRVQGLPLHPSLSRHAPGRSERRIAT